MARLTPLPIGIALALVSAPLYAQGVEVAPFIGIRGGEEATAIATPGFTHIDRDPSLGVTLSVPLWEGLQFEGLFTHEHVRYLIYPDAYGPGARLQGAVDHWQAGGLQEFGRGWARPFLTGALGVTRYAVEADSEFRFAIAAGGGVKVFPTSNVGLRVDGRAFSTFLDAFTTRGVCGGSGCLLGLHLEVAWQFEMTVGVVFKFGPGA